MEYQIKSEYIKNKIKSKSFKNTRFRRYIHDLIFLEKQTPVNISPFGTAQYVLPRTAIGANQGAQVSFNIAVQALTSDVWDTLGSGTAGSRTITTKVKCQGALSGLIAETTITINEEFTR